MRAQLISFFRLFLSFALTTGLFVSCLLPMISRMSLNTNNVCIYAPHDYCVLLLFSTFDLVNTVHTFKLEAAAAAVMLCSINSNMKMQQQQQQWMSIIFSISSSRAYFVCVCFFSSLRLFLKSINNVMFRKFSLAMANTLGAYYTNGAVSVCFKPCFLMFALFCLRLINVSFSFLIFFYSLRFVCVRF